MNKTVGRRLVCDEDYYSSISSLYSSRCVRVLINALMPTNDWNTTFTDVNHQTELFVYMEEHNE